VITPALGTALRQGVASPVSRDLAEETPVALVYDGSTEAVMLATPQDLADFALGFSLTEGMIASKDDIKSLEILDLEGGMEARMWLAPERTQDVAARRRSRMGPTGCGLCGVESLAEANRAVPVVSSGLQLTAAEVLAARSALDQAAALGAATRATHAAGFWTTADGLVLVREDVGRHNAIDKIAGWMRLNHISAQGKLFYTTGRLTSEMVIKTVQMGLPILISRSGFTAWGVDLAKQAGLTLIGRAKGKRFLCVSGAERLVFDADPAEVGTEYRNRKGANSED